MGDLSTLEVIIIAIVEGLTEFLPVSSTGHMIITQNLLGIESTEFVRLSTCGATIHIPLVVRLVPYFSTFYNKHIVAPR